MDIINNLGRPAWAEISLTALSSNVRAFRNFLPGNVRLMAVIKADGYGHGAYETANIALKEGASMLGVASLEEGVNLRQKGINAPVLILGYTEPHQYSTLLKMELVLLFLIGKLQISCPGWHGDWAKGSGACKTGYGYGQAWFEQPPRDAKFSGEGSSSALYFSGRDLYALCCCR